LIDAAGEIDCRATPLAATPPRRHAAIRRLPPAAAAAARLEIAFDYFRRFATIAFALMSFSFQWIDYF